MTRADKVRENRLRNMARRQGLYVQKSRRRDPHALDYGAYWLIDTRGNFVVSGGEWGLTLDQVEEFLTAPPRSRERQL